jgi:two-component system, OmpR family, KDP operon response regulator KdpE
MSDRPRRVLVCDDDSQTVRALQVVLRAAGSAVDATATGAEALDHAALRAPDAGIVELVLPDGTVSTSAGTSADGAQCR